MKKYVTLCCLFLLCGCGATPYFDVGVGYQVNEHSDWYVDTHRDWQCSDNLQGRFAVGADWGKWEAEYYHQSWVFCGGPFNNRPELYQDSINIKYRIGGKE